ncbi:ABC transporter ATP-binding protein [Rhizobium sp. 3T7]|uniref:ABC transporter ATP-binding protein n=1 Tax=Rhizobium sp. 3T7 TaxID=2874922 RepID=UPI001CCEE279|nr:ABC transporter ATP-binding protein [Rhizobium sp. 3T7]MBZ9792895.1 ABC transporter ATP-binding protein [Rhizobium sp. 3T7]
MSSDIAIKVENLSKCYQIYDHPRDRLRQFISPRLQRLVGREARQYFNEFWALKDVSLEVKRGETVGIIGRNGSGKSTLLQLICGTLNPTSGSVQASGRISALLELGSGFNPEFTGRENVYMNAAVLGLSQDEIDSRFDQIAAFADIGHFLDQPVKNYSSGMGVRLAFAVQAMIDPDIFVVDEALAVGDEKFQRKCFARLDELKQSGTSILFVSHSAASIIELCDRALVLDGGIRVMYSRPQEAIRAYQKMIYAPSAEYQKLVREYRAADQSAETIGLTDTANLVQQPPAAPSVLFDPGLVPETTTVYPIQGAEITSISILDENDQPVNVLQADKTYQFVMAGHFLREFSGIFFGLHIRNISGTVITGQRYPEEGLYLEKIRADSDFRISFSFRMSLLAGVYFVGGGIWSVDGVDCPHRVLDAIMFRVSNIERPKSFGYVDLMSNEPTIKLVEG